MYSNILVYDTETATAGVKPNAEKDKLRLFGCYSYQTDKYYILKNKDDIQKIINAHKYLVGFNNAGTRDEPGYDNIVLKNEGIKLDYKIFIDIRDIFKKRAVIMKIKEGMLGDLIMFYSLDFITRLLKIVDEDTSKKKLDFNILKKEMWTEEENNLINEYLKRDIEVTKKLFEWVYNYFKEWQEFLTQDDIEKMKWLTDRPAVFAYKAICKELGVTADFSNVPEQHDAFLGGYVAYPAKERVDGNIVLYDFASLYPNLFVQCNLFSNKCSCCEQSEKWHGDNFFHIEGYYCKKTQGNIEKVLKKWLMLRKEYKKQKDSREYAIKILNNSLYGIVGNSSFIHMFNPIAASDCTSLARQCILYTRSRFKELGYTNLYSDTDSLFVKIPSDKTIEDADKVAQMIPLELQKAMPFAW